MANALNVTVPGHGEFVVKSELIAKAAKFYAWHETNRIRDALWFACEGQVDFRSLGKIRRDLLVMAAWAAQFIGEFPPVPDADTVNCFNDYVAEHRDLYPSR